MAATGTARSAILIDAGNASALVVKELLEEVANFGTATIKRAYGDLEHPKPRGVEGASAPPCHSADAAVRLTRSATRMREAGKLVYGLGECKTPAPFVAACNKFIFFEVLNRPPEAAPLVQVAGLPDRNEPVTHANRFLQAE